MTVGTEMILVLRPLDSFGIVTAELKRVDSLGQYMTVKGRVWAQHIGADQKELRELAALCEELLPDNLFARYANKKVFRHAKDFWATKETVVRQHVKRMADLRLIKAIQLASSADVPLLYAPTDKTPLHIANRLFLDDSQSASPVMNFCRHTDGTTYQLQLRIGDNLTNDLSAHQLIVLAYEPGFFALDNHIYPMCDGLSCQLLLPFVKKSQVEIPRKMENEYFRRFILKHVAGVEVNAEGFDITDIQEPPRPVLSIETHMDGRQMLSFRFRYGNTDYYPDSKTNGRVTLTENLSNDQTSFCFTRQLRNKQQERELSDILLQTGALLSAQGTILFPSAAEMVSWLRTYAPQLKAQGFDVVQPSNHVYYIGPLSVEQSDTWHGDWLQTDVTVVLDDGSLRIPFRDLRDTILRGEQEYLLPTGELLIIPAEWLQRYADLLLIAQPKGQGFQRHRSQVVEEWKVEGGRCKEDGFADVRMQSVLPPPSTFNLPPSSFHPKHFTLRPYQQTGFQWLWQNFLAQTGCCLSDEMGLGKTIQTIALLLHYKEVSKAATATSQPQPGMLFSDEEMRGNVEERSTFRSALTLRSSENVQCSTFTVPFLTSLVVAPASVVHNWQNELARFAPKLMVLNYTGDTDKRRDKRQALMRWDVVLTTYRTLVNDIDHLARQQFGIIVFDESQAFKTATSQVHQAVASLNALHRMALSGTPVENNLSELWSLMNVLNPNLLGDAQSFQKAFVRPVIQETLGSTGCPAVSPGSTNCKMEENRRDLLRRLIAPYFLKRSKEEVLSDLPERQDEVVVCPMTEEQTSRYAEELSKARNEWLAYQTNNLPNHQTTNSPNHQTPIHILAAIQRLRHIANGEGKLAVVFEQLESLRQTRHKVLIFSEYVTLLERVGSEMQSRGWQYDMLTGQTQQREQVIAHFQREPDCQFFLISLKAGGVGLNLTAADYVFILDPWWNHAAEEQAIARAHRIGQRRAVFVYRFVSAGSLEEQILTLQDRKQSLIDSVMPFIV